MHYYKQNQILILISKDKTYFYEKKSSKKCCDRYQGETDKSELQIILYRRISTSLNVNNKKLYDTI